MNVTTSDDIWNSYKELKTITWKYLNENADSHLPLADFENILRRNKGSFFSLLQNPPKNSKKREELKKGMETGINVKGLGPQVLSAELFQETVILSDMFELNELVALDLLCTAQIQMPYYHGLSRGLVAILLYYDGQKALLTTLLYLVQARSGIQWTIDINPGLMRFITDYTDQLMDAGLFNRILELLRSLDLTKEMEKLQDNLALGGPKHRRQVSDLFNDIRNILADIVFSWAIQCGLPKVSTLALLNFLKQVKIESEASGVIDDVTLYLQMALLAALDLSVFHTREDGEEVVQSLPILDDSSFITTVLNELLPTNPKWVNEGLQALSIFGMSVCLASLKVLPQNYVYQDVINKEDLLADTAIEMNVFKFLHNIVLENKTLYKEQFLYKRMHNLLTDFIVYMYPKVKDLRMKANEVSRTLQVYLREGLDAPLNLPRYFEFLLLCIGKFYVDTSDPEYVLTWWSPIEINPTQSLNIRMPPRSVALFKFIKLAGDMLPATLFVPFIKMLCGLSNSKETARHCFNLLKQTGAHLSRTLSWDHFFESFGQYYQNLRHDTPPAVDTVYRLRSGYHKGVSPQELEGLNAVLYLIQTVARYDEFVCLALCEHPAWSPLTFFLGLVSCSVPIHFKADLLETLAVLSKSIANANQMWENLESSQILVTIPTTSSYAPRGIETELDEIESRMEEYPLTRAVLKLLDSLTDFGIPRNLGAGPRKPGFDPYFHFIVNSVFLKYNSRSYKDVTEKWNIALLCLTLFEKFLRNYEPKASDFPKVSATSDFNSPPGYHLMVQLSNKTETLNNILNIIDEGNQYFDTFTNFPGQEKLQECSLFCLRIIHRALALQDKFFEKLSLTSASIILTGIRKLLTSINPRTGSPDHCINIAKYLGYQSYAPKHAMVAVKILCHVTLTATSHNTFMNILTCTEDVPNLIKSGFFQCLDSSIDDTETGNTTKLDILKLLKQCLNYRAPNLTHLLMGFNLKHDISKTDFQYPGVLGFPRTCLHSLLSILDSAITRGLDVVPIALSESAYHLFYLLASNWKTSGPVLRFVRSNKLFYCIHLKECEKHMNKGSKYLLLMSWLMKTLAIELKTASSNKQITYLKQLISFLGNIAEGKNSILMDKILTIELKSLQDVPLINPIAEPPSGDAKLMKQRLINEKKFTEACSSVVQFVDSWRQVVEVIVTYVPMEIVNSKDQQIFGIHITQNLLKKVHQSEQLFPEVSRLLSGCVLLTLNNIKRNHFAEEQSVNILNYYLGSLKEILENLIRWIMTSDVVDSELRVNLYASLITFLQITGVEYDDQDITKSIANLCNPGMDISRHNFDIKDKPVKLSTDIISSFGEKLMEVISQDCIGGQEISRILAMSCFSQLMVVTGDLQWIHYLSRKGYLRHIIASILDSDKDLRTMLEPGAPNMKEMYLYLAKMLLLIRLTGSKMGAQMILEQKLLGVFNKMSLFSYHPEISKIWHDDTLEDFIPPPDKRFLQLYFPALDVCNAILTTLGTGNESAVVQIMHFLLNHLDVVELVLRSGNTDLSALSLKELARLTLVIARTANNNLINILENPNIVVSHRAHLFRIQKLMLNLISKFLLSDDNVKRLTTPSNNERISYQTSERLVDAMQIASNLVWYARNVIANKDIQRGELGVIFYPSLYDPKLHPFQTTTTDFGHDQDLSLGLIVQQLLYTVNYQHQGKVTYDLLQRKLHEVPNMNSLELMDFIEERMEVYDMEDKKRKAKDVISERLANKKKEMDHCAFIIENCLYLIWAHLDYFMLRAIPNPRSMTYIHPSITRNSNVSVPAPSEAISKVSTEVIFNLRQGLVSLFNDSFSKQLLETAQDQTELNRNFIETLLRKIKRLIQFVNVDKN